MLDIAHICNTPPIEFLGERCVEAHEGGHGWHWLQLDFVV